MLGPPILHCGSKQFKRDEKTLIMGIVNVTPDSFSDGAKFYRPDKAIEHGLRLLSDGADILDIGGVSTAPFAKPVSEQEELDRVIPVVEGLVRHGVTTLSVDTMRACVARTALEAKASWINDQSAGLHDEKMPTVMVKAQGVIIMHNGGGLTSGVEAGEEVFYDNVATTVTQFFEKRINELTVFGVCRNNIIVDPGIGFGKGLKDSLALIQGMDLLRGISVMSLIGLSRKSLIGRLSGISAPNERDIASLGAMAVSVLYGADIVRTHDVKAAAQFFGVFNAARRKP